ncbi:MAG: biopolymer transporter ExbD [Pseudomonadales bacterium]|nr:biopolymer transporter ExbD [Pseudomonadales bacterium]
MKAASKRARRMERHHKRGKQPALNLVSLMDVFTILVFFLLVSSSDVKQPPSRKDVRLPETVSDTLRKNTLIITVTEKEILVEGIKVTDILSLLPEEQQNDLPKLKAELALRAKAIQVTSSASEAYSVTIFADESMPYNILSRVLTTCQSENYTKISFAALQVSKKKPL